MKRIILFIFMLIIINICTCVCTHAEGYTKYPSSNATLTYNDDTYKLEYKEPYNLFRINKNNTDYSYFEVDGYTLNKVKMKIINNSLYVYGSVQIKIKEDWDFYYVPVLYKFSLDPEYINKYEYSDIDNTGEKYSFTSSVETIDKFTYISLGFNLERGTVNYYGNYKIIKLDENYNKVNEYSLASEEISLYKIYDYLVINKGNKIIYLNRELELKESYNETDTYLGTYMLESDTTVNGVLKEKGTYLSVPGKYSLKEESYLEKEINVEPIIEISENDDGFSYRVSGGDVYINDNIVPLTGDVSGPGEYLIEVVGINSYAYTKTIIVEEEIEFEFKESYSIGDSLEFTGNAYLNDEKIESGYVINEAGSYVLEFKSGDEVIESYEFIVEEELITNDDKKIMYIVLSGMIVISILILFIILIVDIIKKRKAKKALYNE